MGFMVQASGAINLVMAEEDNDYSSPTKVSAQLQRNALLFQEEYQDWRNRGHCHIVAYRKAIDYWRKYLNIESTIQWEEQVDMQLSSEDAKGYDEVLEGIQFNQIINKVLDSLEGDVKQSKLFCLIILQNDLEEHLNKESVIRVMNLVGSEKPFTIKDMAKILGFKLNNIDVCTSITKRKKKLRNLFEELGYAIR